MKAWNLGADLPKIKVRTLTMGARYDEMDPADMLKMPRFFRMAKRRFHKPVVTSRRTTISQPTLKHFFLFEGMSTSVSDGVPLRLQEDDNALRFH